jgi:NAD(P)-dependent dehydrogenase (short-subunit alcohol dehydrogenase family)
MRDSVRDMAAAGERAVLVTGASSGIGEATASHLQSLGVRVFAGVRKEADVERLGGRERLTPVRLDVTEADSVASARREVEESAPGGLHGLVNNAGVSVSGPIEFLPIEELRRQLEVNVVGQVAVTQAFLPAVRRARGRIVNVSSVGGRVALPLMSPYNASKFALEAISDSLRREVRRFGVHVAVVEPGAIRTAIWEKGTAAADEMMQNVPPEAEELYGELVRAMRAQADNASERALEPIEVARVVEHALTADRPRIRYLVGRDAKLRARLADALPDRAFDALIERTLSR